MNIRQYLKHSSIGYAIIAAILIYLIIALCSCGTVKKTTSSKSETSNRVTTSDSVKKFNRITVNTGNTDIQTDIKETAKRQTITEKVYIFDTIRNVAYLKSEKTIFNEETAEETAKREHRIDSLIDVIAENSKYSYRDSTAAIKTEATVNKEVKRFSSSFWFWLIGVAIVAGAVWVAYKFLFKK